MSDGFKGLRLYNTLTRTKEAFAPIDPNNVRMYVCGPTVYDYAHIGNARPAIVFDVLFRLLRHLYGDDHVTYVRNITDVDDKINARALRDYGADIASGKLSLNEAIRKVTEPTYGQYQKDVTALGCLPPTVQPRATEFVLPRADGKADMVTLIQSLIDRGHAYVSNGEVLFDVTSMPDYGGLSKRNLDEQQAGARVAVEAHKKHPADFVLWKESSAEEPGWEGHFNLPGGGHSHIHGRPGWHIECSAMSAAYLGEVFDIHGGGLDLIFPHHENEIAQSRCAHGTEMMANVWMHNGFLQVEGKKMSKSDGNFVTINELLETEKFGGRKWPGEVLRLAMLMTHYREPIDFSVRKLEEAENTLRKWKRAADLADVAAADLPGAVIEALQDDLGTYQAFQILSELAAASTADVAAAASLKAALSLLGFDTAAADVDDMAVTGAISARLAFIAAKNWAEADRIRDELLAQGIQLKDGKDPATGERITTWEVKKMIDHTGIFVADAAKSTAFYDAVFAALGGKLLMTVPPEHTGGKLYVGYGRQKPDFWVVEASETGPGRHYAFVARSRAEVDAFYKAAMAAGGRDNGGPGIRAHYHPDYYGAFVLDPDGNNIEAVCHGPE